jgi:hypothetical protein
MVQVKKKTESFCAAERIVAGRGERKSSRWVAVLDKTI